MNTQKTLKAFLIVFFGVLTVLLAGCSGGSGGVATEPRAEGGEIRVYEVFGMDCPGCQGGLEKLVRRIPAVKTAVADWVAQKLTVTVKAGETLDDAAIYDAITRANFTRGKRIK